MKKDRTSIGALSKFMWEFQDQRDRLMDFLQKLSDENPVINTFYQEMSQEIEDANLSFNGYDWTQIIVAVDPELSFVDDAGRRFDPNLYKTETVNTF